MQPGQIMQNRRITDAIGKTAIFTLMITALTLCVCQKSRSAEAGVTEKLKEYMDATVRVKRFSRAVLVGRDDEVLLQAGYGEANYE
jgi:hypothetical protein